MSYARSMTLNAGLVSVIVPVYNSKDNIEATLSSVLQQTYKNIEIVVVDDGSTDDVNKMLIEYENHDPRVRYIHKENGGVSSARNLGVRVSKGEYVAFIDSDDLWDVNKIQLQVNKINSDKTDVVLSGLVRFFIEDGVCKLGAESYFNSKKEQSLKDVLAIDNTVMAIFGTALIRKKILTYEYLFDEALIVAEDWDLWLRLSRKYKFSYLDQPLRLYKKHDKSLTRSTSDVVALRCINYVIDKNSKYAGISFLLRRKIKSQHYLVAAKACLRKKHYIRSLFLLPNIIFDAKLFFSGETFDVIKDDVVGVLGVKRK